MITVQTINNITIFGTFLLGVFVCDILCSGLYSLGDTTFCVGGLCTIHFIIGKLMEIHNYFKKTSNVLQDASQHVLHKKNSKQEKNS